MNSLSLKESGFAEFIPIKVLSFSALPIEKGSVLVLADSSITGKPASDILYIGKSKKPSKRVFGGYLSGYGGKTTEKSTLCSLMTGSLKKWLLAGW